MIEPYETISPRIYAYSTPGVTYHDGWLKIGYTATQTVDDRIKQINHVGWIIYNTELIHLAPFDAQKNKQLTDKDFHKFLTERYKIKRAGEDLEWFKIDATTVRKYMEEFCAGKTYRTPPKVDAESYTLRDEQISAVEKTLDYWLGDENPREYLWNAKPRFGKNLAVYEFIKQYDAKKVLIVTNRPAIANSWHEDFKKFAKQNPNANYIFAATTAAIRTKPFDGTLAENQRLIAFISLQDLKGAKNFGGDFDKLGWIKNFHWDILVVDESHEGVDTEKTQFAFENIARDFTLHLSGTPFKAIANENFRAEQIFNWSYFDEQNAKRNFEAEPNPYADLPRMNLFSYKLSDIVAQKISASTILDEENVDYAFDLNEFFSTDKKGKFIHEADVKKFLDALTHNENFPFSTPKFRAELQHTFWLMYRVDSAKAMAKLLQEHEIFKHYEIIVAAGDGKIDSEETSREESFKRVTKAIENHEKTITLSVGQLTTGVTIPEWTAVLMLSELKSPTAYIQAAFRAQNPHIREINGLSSHKKDCYIFDFSPTRSLEIYAQFAESLCGGAGENENIRRLLNFFPVLAEDSSGKMIPLNAEKIMSLPQTIKINHTVDSGFMSNFLFNVEKIARVFQAPTSVEKILRKLPRDDSKKNRPFKITLPTIKIDENGNVILDAQNVDAQTEKIFGGKKYTPSEKITPSDIAKEIAGAVREKYSLTKAQADSLAQKIDKKISNDASAENIARVQREVVEQLEKKSAEDSKRKKESDIRALLRGFARTIPLFLMAYGSQNLTLANFETCADDKTFEEITGITKAEFRYLRDGGDLGGEHFDGGLFNETVFNGAIQKFFERKDLLADYFSENHSEDIFSFIPPQRTNLIFTPKNIVTEMLDALERQNPGIFDDPSQKFLDPYIKSGIFIAEIVKRLYRSPALKNIFPSDTYRLQHILTQQVFGFAPTDIILKISTNFIFGAKNTAAFPRNNFRRVDLVPLLIQNPAERVTVLDKFSLAKKARVKKFGEVFTPPDTVNLMLNVDYIKEIVEDPNAKILEPTAGTGAFLVEILRRRIAKVSAKNKFKAIANIYAIELQLDNLTYARQALADIFKENFSLSDAESLSLWKILNANILQGDALSSKNHLGKSIKFPCWTFNANSVSCAETFDYSNLVSGALEIGSKVDLIVGNPPYQLDTSGDNKTFAKPVYHCFLEEFHKRCDRVLMIHPARFLFQAGATPKDFIKKILADEHFSVIKYFPNAGDVFSGVDIKGGVAISYRDANEVFGAIDTFIPFKPLKAIFDKVTTRKDFKPLSEIICSRTNCRLTEKVHQDYPNAKDNLSKGNLYPMSTNIFNLIPQIFFEKKPNDGNEYIGIWGFSKSVRVFKFIRRDYVNDFKAIDEYKVFIPDSYGAGAFGEKGPTALVGLPLVGLPLVGCTETFQTLGAFDSAAQAEAAMKFVKTKFARALLGVLKVTQHNPPETWRFVPQQNFGADSDVPWEKPVAQIDAYLYQKYSLSAEEIAFIESNVKAMD